VHACRVVVDGRWGTGEVRCGRVVAFQEKVVAFKSITRRDEGTKATEGLLYYDTHNTVYALRAK